MLRLMQVVDPIWQLLGSPADAVLALIWSMKHQLGGQM